MPTLTGLDCCSRVVAFPLLTVYNAVIAFPDDDPAQKAKMSVAEAAIVHVKYETD